MLQHRCAITNRPMFSIDLVRQKHQCDRGEILMKTIAMNLLSGAERDAFIELRHAMHSRAGAFQRRTENLQLKS